MKRILVVAITLGMSAFVAPAAHADLGDMIEGGCFFDTLENPTDNTVNRGVIGDHSITTKGTAPTGATVTCWIEVNGVEAPGTRFSYSGTGVQAGVDPISFVAGPDDLVAECEVLVFADGTGDAGCPIDHGDPQLPPQFVLDWINALNDDLVAAEVAYVDPVVCPVLVTAAGAYPGGLTIAPDGDVYVPDPLGFGINPVWDCPPYINF
jgi:hypothetical protein